MATQEKPNVNVVWASAGEATPVPPAKQAQGYVDEIPYFDDFNGHMKMISEFMKHINLEGIAVWDATTEYPVNGLAKSPVDGNVYQANSINTNTPPIASGVVNTAWRAFGVQLATQAEAEEGTNNAKYMSPLRVAQSIAARLKAATTSIAGIIKIATTGQVNAGTDDTTAVTPAKMLAGLVGSVNLAIGFLKLPDWMGGLTLQWGNAVQSGAGVTVSYPRAFTSQAYAVFCQPVPGANRAQQVTMTAVLGTRFNFNAYLSRSDTYINGGFYWFAIGR